jgi:hypothetical protein
VEKGKGERRGVGEKSRTNVAKDGEMRGEGGGRGKKEGR